MYLHKFLNGMKPHGVLHSIMRWSMKIKLDFQNQDDIMIIKIAPYIGEICVMFTKCSFYVR